MLYRFEVRDADGTNPETRRVHGRSRKEAQKHLEWTLRYADVKIRYLGKGA